MTAPFLILGHRGARTKTHFQNSMSAFREAVDGADGFETDTAISADGVIYLIHDITYIHSVEYTLCEMLDAPSAIRVGTRRLDQMQSAEIDMLRLKNGEPIPKLTEALALFRDQPNKVLNLELKSDNTAAPVIDLVRKTIDAGQINLNQIVISSFNFPAMLWIKENAPEFKRGVLFSLETQKREPLFPWGKNLASCYTPFRESELTSEIMREIDPHFINLALTTMSLANIGRVLAQFPDRQFIVWPSSIPEPAESEAPYVLDLLFQMWKQGQLYAWITDEPRLHKQALLAHIE